MDMPRQMWPYEVYNAYALRSLRGSGRFRFLEIAGGAFGLLAATGIAETDDMTAEVDERIGRDRVAEPWIYWVNAFDNVKD